MTSTNSTLFFEVTVDSIKSYIDLGVFAIKCQFANKFTLQLKDPNDVKMKDKKKSIRKGKRGWKKQSGHTVFSVDDTNLLIQDMNQFPMEVSLWSKTSPDNKVGSALITWSQVFINYLKKLKMHLEPPPATITREYSVFDEVTSKRMATVMLNMRLVRINDNRVKLQTEQNSAHVPPNTLRKNTSNIVELKSLCIRNSTESPSPTNNSTTLKDWQESEKFHNEKNIFVNNENLQSTRSIDVLPIYSDDSITSTRIICPVKTRSFSNIYENTRIENLMYNYYDNQRVPLQKPVYCVGYVTVGDPKSSSKKENSSATQNAGSNKKKNDFPEIDENSTTYKFKLCDRKCLNQDFLKSSTINLPNDLRSTVHASKCKEVTCEHRNHREVPDREQDNDRIFIDMKSMTGRCCENIKVEEVVGEVKLKMDSDPCSCSCECSFGFTKKTTYCTVCGGYESAGEDVADKLPFDQPYPCPVYHNIIDKNKIKNIASFGSDGKKKEDTTQKGSKGASKSDKKSAGEKGIGQLSANQTTGGQTIGGGQLVSGQAVGQTAGGQAVGGEASAEKEDKKGGKKKRKDDKFKLTANQIAGGQTVGGSQLVSGQAVGQTAGGQAVGGETSVEKEDKKGGKKKRKDDRFKFNYGYQAPHIGHSQCAFPCGGGTLNNVPKGMGWLWNADIPGLKYRQNWKPGAAHKHVVRMLRIAKNPGEVLTKRKRKETSKKKRPLKRPLLVVQKKEGEFTITMETMKAYNKPRALNQPPYDDKAPVSYTIGRTEEENLLRQRKKQREKRRLERAQRMFVQSTFQNLCKDICLKTYQQALGILPDTEKPDCPCYPALPDVSMTNMNVSCSCSEDSLFSDSDTDDWIIEFTPPNCLYDPTYKPKKTPKSESFAQYSIQDYKVRKVDRYGKEVPRYFKGPDGQQYCSDLGGFRGQDGKWYEINVDGSIGPDGRWYPNVFTGPNGEQIDAEHGTFQAANGQTYEVGVHGYVDAQGKWRFYSKTKGVSSQKANKNLKVDTQVKASEKNNKGGGSGDKKDIKVDNKPSETFSCFGDTSAKQLSKLGIVGHGQDKKLLQATVKDMISKGMPVKMPEYTTVPRFPGGDKKRRNLAAESKKRFLERSKCKHATPSEKGVLAVDGLGNKTYFRIKECQNVRPQERVAGLNSQGISLSSFHVPCFTSFINSEYMRQQQCMRILELAQQCKNTATQVCV